MSRNKKRKNKNTLKKPKEGYLFHVLFGSIILLLPVIYSPAILDKTLMPRLVTLSVILLVFSFFILIKKKTPPFFNRSLLNLSIFWAVAAFLLVTIATTSQSINYKESYFDIAKTILFSILMVYAYFTFEKAKNWQQLLTKYFALATLIALAIGYNQYFELVLFSKQNFLPDGRAIIYAVDGLMSHKNLYASSLLLMFPFVVYGIYSHKGKWRLGMLLIGVLHLFMIFVLKTRAVWVGLAAGIGVAVLILLIYNTQFALSKKWKKRIVVAIIGGVILGAGLLTQLEASGRFSTIERVKSIFNPSHSDNVYRLMVWDLSTKMIKDNPILGVGPGNWKIEAGNYAHEYGFLETQIKWYRPHNDYLWVLAEKGVFGFAAYLALFIIVIYYLMHVIRKSTDSQNVILALCLLSGIVAYAAASFFDFPYERITHQAFLGIMFAASARLYIRIKQATGQPLRKIYLTQTFAVLVGLTLIYSLSALKFEKQNAKIRVIMEQQNFDRMLQMVKNTPQLFRNMDPEFVPIYSYAGFAYFKKGQLKKAKRAYEKSLEVHPTNIYALRSLALVHLRMGHTEKGKELLNKALFIVPTFASGLKNLSIFYEKQGDLEKSYEILQKIRREDRSDEIKKRMEYLQKKINSR